MLKPRWIVLTTFLIATLLAGGTAWGDTRKPAETEPPELKAAPHFALEKDRTTLAIAPWPNPYGWADKSRRSALKGPGGIMAQEYSINMVSVLGLTGNMGDKVFAPILVGPGNMLYFKVASTNVASATLYAFKQETGIVWQASVGSSGPVCLDDYGNVYFATLNHKHLESRDKAGGVRWSYQYSSNGTMRLWTVGSRAYLEAIVGVYQNKYLVAVNKNGTKAWSVSLDNDIIIKGVSEDSAGNVYIRAEDWKKGIHKYDSNGVLQWQTQLACPFVQLTEQQYYADMGPICGNDNRVWLNERYAFIADKGYSSTPTYVLNTDGTIYNCGSDVIEKKYTGACYSSDGILCLATDEGDIYGISNWDTILWSSQVPWWGNIPTGGKIKAMVMDSENIGYALYQVNGMRILYMFDAANGDKLGTEMVNIPGTPGVYDWLAIGEDERLAVFNSKGYLKIYKPTMEDLPIYLEDEPERYKLEKIKKINGDD